MTAWRQRLLDAANDGYDGHARVALNPGSRWRTFGLYNCIDEFSEVCRSLALDGLDVEDLPRLTSTRVPTRAREDGSKCLVIKLMKEKA